MGAFIESHKRMKKDGERKNDPYYTKESYLATVVHEAGHRLYLEEAGEDGDWTNQLTVGGFKKLVARLKNSDELDLANFPKATKSEAMAMGIEMLSASISWPEHKRNMELDLAQMKQMFNLAPDDSRVENWHHVASYILAQEVMKQYPDDWLKKLTQEGQVSG